MWVVLIYVVSFVVLKIESEIYMRRETEEQRQIRNNYFNNTPI